MISVKYFLNTPSVNFKQDIASYSLLI